MKKQFILFLIFLIITSVLFFQSCKKASQPTEPSTDIQTKIPESTKIFSPQEVTSNLISISSDSTTFYFNTSVTTSKNIKVNDIIALTVNEGILRKVVSVKTVNNQLVVQTTDATLSEAIESGVGSFSQVLTPSQIEKVIYYVEGLEINSNRLYKPDQGKLFFIINSILYDEDADTSTKGDQLALNGSFNLTPEINGIFQFSGFNVKKFQAEFKINEQLDLNLNMGLFELTGTKEKKLATIKFNPFIVYVGIPPVAFPILIGPEIDLILGASLELNSNLETGITQSLSHTIGLVYENGKWSNYKTNSEDLSFKPPSLGASLKTKIYIKPELKLKVYGTVSPYLSTELYGEFDANTSSIPWWKLYAGLHVAAGVKMQIFSRTILNYGTTFLSVKALVAQANTNPPPSAPTLLSPANGAVNVTIPTTLSWNASSGTTSYTLQVSTNSNFTSFVYNESGITGTSQQVPGLNNSTQYYWRVRATNSNGNSAWSLVRNFTTTSGGQIPSVPTLLLPADGSINVTIPTTLSRNTSSGATSYTLQISTNNNFTNLVYNDGGITETSRQISGLSFSTKYYWRVRALNSFGSSNWSTVRSFTTISDLTTQGLVAYYTFNSNFNDLSGNQFHGTPINNPTFGIDRFNRTNSAIYLNGTNQYISLPNTINITHDITISFWIKTNLIDNGSWPFGTFIIDRDICGESFDWSIGLGLGGKVQFNTGLLNQDDVLNSSLEINGNNWTHIVIIRDAVNQKKKIYINGILNTTSTFGSQEFINNSINIFIGASFCDTFNHNFYKGLIDDLRFYNRVLTESEIQQLYNEN